MYNNIRNLNPVSGADWKSTFVASANQKLTKRFCRRKRHSPAENRGINITILFQVRDFSCVVHIVKVIVSLVQSIRIYVIALVILIK